MSTDTIVEGGQVLVRHRGLLPDEDLSAPPPPPEEEDFDPQPTPTAPPTKVRRKKGEEFELARIRAQEEVREKARANAARPSAPEGPKVYTENGDVPATASRAEQRDGVTIGVIENFRDQSAPPRNLQELCSRYPIGHDRGFYIRVERTQPRYYQNIPVSGYLGDIATPISEAQFQAYFGGREYMLTVYGPDPKGAHSKADGRPISKPLTEPIKVTVPLLPPNLEALPALNEEAMSMNMPGFSPFGHMGGNRGGAPATPADAAMHKTNVDFVTKALEMSEKEKVELRRAAQQNGVPNGSLDLFTNFAQEAVKQARADADARERVLREELKEYRDQVRELNERMEKAKAEAPRGPDLEGLLKAVMPTRNASADLERAQADHERTLAALREQHRESVEGQRERTREEIARVEERMRLLDDRHREEMTRTREMHERGETDLKKLYEQRIYDIRAEAEKAEKALRDRFEDRIKDLERANDRELRSLKENTETRVVSLTHTWEMRLSTMEERARVAREEADRAKAEAEAAGDPAAVLAKAKEQAEALGYTKADDSAPKGPWDRLAAAAGMAIANVDKWLPNTIQQAQQARVQAQQQGAQQRRLPPGAPGGPQQGQQQPQQPRQPQQQRRPVWATEDSIPMSGALPAPQRGGALPLPPPAPPATQGWPPTQQTVPQQEEAQAPPPQQPAPPAPSQPQAASPQQQVAGFPDEVVVDFIRQMEGVIDMGVPPEQFAAAFVAQYPEPSRAMVTGHKPDDLIARARTLSATTALARTDGRQWVNKLWAKVQEAHGAGT
jgi:hypothetical protein